MKECFQTANQNMLAHGQSVRSWYLDLNRLVLGEKHSKEWRLPDWINHSTIFNHLEECANAEAIKLYQIYHDCGKPFCREVDVDGRQHFPNHAEVSKARWLECGGSQEVADLIGMDMDVHTLKACEVEEFARRPQAITLLLTGLCELHSNAQMFGGVESTGFKIKFKNLERFGKRILDAQAPLTHYVVVRKDIPPGAQLAQSVHAAGESPGPKPVPGTTAVVLHAADEKHLSIVKARLDKAGISAHCVYESDDDKHFPGQMMSIGVEPTSDRDSVKRILSSLPLAK